MRRRVLAGVALALGVLAAFAGSPYKDVSAVQLAQWIKNRKPGLQVIDMRSISAYDSYHIPTSVWIRASARNVSAEKGTTVVITDDQSSVPQNAYVLRGGVDEWRRQDLSPKKPTEVSRYFGGVRRGGC